ncbi:MAG: hypothetical protein PHQ12_00820, partial [Chthoniobacteraceae bacterium]|nr:hypothetical protein [Chthoniobacteraceae bacterium]
LVPKLYLGTHLFRQLYCRIWLARPTPPARRTHRNMGVPKLELGNELRKNFHASRAIPVY